MSAQAQPEAGFVNRLFSAECNFVCGAPQLESIPVTEYPEIAFIGRSNVGKSSLINALVNRHNLARTSETPGRTQHLNFFLLDDKLMLVDLPGYGYAKAPRDMVEDWNRLIRDYLRGRPTLRRVFVLIDSRRGLMPPDTEMMKLLDEAAVPYQVTLTKTDKLKPPALEKLAAATRAAIATHPAAHPELLATSAHKQSGLMDVRGEIAGFISGV